MQRIQLHEDIRPLSEFRANVASYIQQVHQTNRPLVITHHGKSTAVLLNVNEYENLLEKLDLLEDIQKAERQIDAGKGIVNGVAKKLVLKRYKG